MNCLESQSYIMPFIEGKIPDGKQEEFVMHMNNCAECHEELQIYYTLITGMKHLEDNGDLSMDLSAELEKELSSLDAKVKGRRRARFSTFSMVFIVCITVLAIYYSRCLNIVYEYEQKTKLNNQGTYYFYSELSDKMVIDYPDRIEKNYENISFIENYEIEHEVPATVGRVFYKRVEIYQNMNTGVNSAATIGQKLGTEKSKWKKMKYMNKK